MSEVFISYSRGDRPVAQLLADQLERAGYEVWFDRELLSGEDFEQEITRRLASAKAVIVLWSVLSVRSGYVRDEAAAAMERGVLLPVRLDGAAVPMGFRSLNVIQFDADNPTDLLRAIVRLTRKAPLPMPPPPRRGVGLGMVEGAVAALLALAFAAFVLRMTR